MDLRLRMLVAVPRSGSTLFMRIMAENWQVGVTSRMILMGNMPEGMMRGSKGRVFDPDYRVFDGPHFAGAHPVYDEASAMGKDTIVSKEEFGNDATNGTPELNECRYTMFPTDDAITMSKPVFLFREPQRVFDSWLSRGWDDLNSFITSYESLLSTYRHCKNVEAGTFHYTHEALVADVTHQELIINRICEYWGLTFSREMLSFRDEFGENFLFWDERERAAYLSENPKDIFTSVKRHPAITSELGTHDLLSTEQSEDIGRRLGKIYAQLSAEEQAWLSNQ